MMCGMKHTQMRFLFLLLYKKGCVYSLFHIISCALKYAFFFGNEKREKTRTFCKIWSGKDHKMVIIKLSKMLSLCFLDVFNHVR